MRKLTYILFTISVCYFLLALPLESFSQNASRLTQPDSSFKYTGFETGKPEAEYEFIKYKTKLTELQKQGNSESEKKIAEQKVYLIVAVALLIISILVAFQLYRDSRLQKKTNEILKEKNRQINRLKELNEIKSQLFSIISHDLRSPLSSLSGFIQLYEADALSKDEIDTLMPMIADKLEYTSGLLDNLLSWAKNQLEGYQTDPEEFDARHLTGEVLPIIEQKANAKNISISNLIEDHITIAADKKMTEITLLNLMSNAVKFTPENGNIEIQACSENGTVRISVKDTGVGIPKEKLELIFANNTFYSTPGTDNENGTGLGLMLCKDFIQRNNGKLWVESEPGAGSTFFFSLPAGQVRHSETVLQLEREL